MVDSEAPVGETLLFFPVTHRDDGGYLKNMLLFFDHVRLVAPKKTIERAWAIDEAIYAPLKNEGLLTEAELSDLLDLPKLDVELPNMREQPDNFMKMMLAQLWQQFQQAPVEGGEGGAMDMLTPTAFALLFHCARRTDSTGHYLSPGTDTPEMVAKTQALFSGPQGSNLNELVEADVQQVGVDMAGVPIDEFLDFRRQHREVHKVYMREVRDLLQELYHITEEGRERKLSERRERINEYGKDLKKQARNEWKQAASLSAAIGGVAWSAATMEPIGVLIGGFSLLLGISDNRRGDQGCYSYLFSAAQKK